MVNLDIRNLRYLTKQDFRVLTAFEIASKNHEYVPIELLIKISKCSQSACARSISILAQFKLIKPCVSRKENGFRLTFAGADHLALKALCNRGSVQSVGNQIGVGKESDIYVVSNESHETFVLKLHRLGRTSFRAVKNTRDYLGKRKSASWQYLSRLAAEREFAYLRILFDNGFPVPKPLDQSRHCIVMEFIDAYPLRSVGAIENVSKVYSELMQLIVRLAENGLIHGDFNEFNILLADDASITIIDLPQMVSIDHKNAEEYLNRDVDCIRTFFEKKFRFKSEEWPKFSEIQRKSSLDRQVAASGHFSASKVRHYEDARIETIGDDSDVDNIQDNIEKHIVEDKSDGNCIEVEDEATVP